MRVVVRADATDSGGVGHVMRAVALAEALRTRGDTAVLVGEVAVPFAERACRAAGLEVVAPGPAHGLDRGGVEALAVLARRLGADVLHVDHYAVADSLQAACRERGLPVSTMADGVHGLRPADLVVDPTLGATGDGRARLGGVAYAPVRRRVTAARRARERCDPAAPMDVLVVMGGTDPLRVTPAVVALLARLAEVGRVRVVSTGADRRSIRAAGAGLDLRVSGPVADLARLAVRHTFAVSAAGTTTVELACAGVPMALVPVVANQEAGYRQLVDSGVALGLGTVDDVRTGVALEALRRMIGDARLRDRLGSRGRELVDGGGAERIVQAWHSLTVPLTVRPARETDADLLFAWRNDHATRSASRETAPVTSTAHREWLARTLATDERVLLLVEAGEVPVATVRFDRLEPGAWEVSVTVAPERRGEGLAAGAVQAAQRWLEGHVGAPGRLVAVHRDGNEASQRLFASLGYVPDVDRPADPGFRRLVRRGPTSAGSPWLPTA